MRYAIHCGRLCTCKSQYDLTHESMVAGEGSLGVLIGHKTNLWAVAWHPKEDYLISADSKGILKSWGADALQMRDQDARTLIDQEELIARIDWSPDSKRLAFAGRDGGHGHCCRYGRLFELRAFRAPH